MASLFGRYEYAGELGRGASGRVFAAVDHAADGARRAIKVVPREEAGRLLWEFARLCQVDHPRVARVRELLRLEDDAPAPFSLASGVLLLVEDFVDGAQLSSAIGQASDASARLELAARVSLGIAEALSALHERGLVHGDLKPDNVLCDARGEGATLIDLGFARPVALASVPRGTPAYMAPELFAGVCTRAADVFALGALIYDTLRGDARAVTSSRAHVPWRKFELAQVVCPPAVTRLLERLLEPDHERRPADAQAARALLVPAFSASGVELADTSSRALALDVMRTPEQRAARASTSPFIGHTEALAQLTGLLASAPVVLVRGPRGAGRSRLVREAIRRLQEQRAREGRSVPTWVDSLAALELLQGVEAVLWLDDVSVDALPAIARAASLAKLALRSVCVVAECASDATLTGAAYVEVASLSDVEFAALLAQLCAPERASGAVVAAARAGSLGLAGRLCQLAATLLLAGRDLADPRTWSAAHVETHVATLSPDALELARALAWWGSAFSPAHAARLLQLRGEGASERAYEELRGKGLLVPDARASDGALSLTASLARELRQDVDAVRGVFARRVAATGVRSDAGFALLAEGQSSRAAQAFLHEALSLRGLGHSDAASALLAEARRFVRDDKLGWLHADSERAAGRYADALAALADEHDEASSLLRAELLRLNDQTAAAHALLGELATHAEPVASRARAQLARVSFDAADLARARTLAGSVLRAPDREAQLRALEVEVLCCLYTGELSAAPSDALVESASTAQRVPLSYLTRAPARAHALRAQVLLRRGERARALRDLRSAVDEARALGEAVETATYALNLGLTELESGELGRALDTLREAAQRLVRVARTRELARVLFNFAALSLLVGDYERCEVVLGEARRALDSAPDPVVRAFVGLIAAELAFSRGALESAERELDQALAELPEAARAARTVLCARASQVASARQALDRAEQRLQQARASADADDESAMLELSTAELALSLARADPAEAERTAQRGLARLGETGSFSERLRFLLVSIESARAAANTLAVSERSALARAWLERALLSLPSELRARMRQVPAYARVFASADYERDAPASPNAIDAPERWRALVRASRRLFAESREARIAQRLGEVALELVPAERALVIAFDDHGQLSILARSELSPEGDRALGFSRSVIERVALDRKPLMTVEAGADVRLDRAESVAALHVRSVLCIELFGLPQRAFLYLDDRLRPAAFSSEDVALLEDLVELSRQALRTGDELLREGRRVRRAELQQRRLRRELARGALRGPESGSPLIGHSAALARVVGSARKVASSDAPLLITGESGTGKELLARFVHDESPRKAQPFVAESCAALPDSLLESALFGHVRGAFTGAERAHRGLFETADGGTLFLDEVGEMSPSLQGKLLRVLQEGELRPVGSERTRNVDVRVIGATRRDLLAMVREGRFREDLYYRLAVVTLELPALRERVEDIAALTAHFLDKHGGDRKVQLTPRALRALEQRGWPGNVRELENEVRRALAFSDSEIDLQHLSQGKGAEEPDGLEELDLHGRTDHLTRTLVREALARADGNVTRAATLLGLSRFGLQKILKRLQLSAK